MAFMLYLAGGYASEVETQLLDMGVNRLYSQLNDRKLGERWLEYNKNVAPRNILVDSGAYSAHTKGKVVDVDDYIAYVNANQGAFQGIAQLDTIPGKLGVPKTLRELAEAPEQSWQNYLYMRQHVKDVECLIPVFHQGEDFKHLNRLLEWTDEKGNHIPYIGISPANDVALKFRDSWMSVVFHHIKKSSNPNVKTHGFGVTSFNILQKYEVFVM